MRTDTQKEHITGIIGTLIFHALVILFLLFYYIHPSVPPSSDELEGVPVMFGNVPDAAGDNEGSGRGVATKPDAAVEESKAVDSPSAETVLPQPKHVEENKSIVTQDEEETIALKKEKEHEAERLKEEKKQEEIAIKEKRKEEAEAERKARAEAEQKKNINNQMSGLFGNGAGNGSRGTTTGTGTQGVVTGNASTGKTSGTGGWGSYDLGGRGTNGTLVKPSYSANDYGTVVVDIIVDPQGNVVESSIGKGTNTPSPSLRKSAMEAARKTKFTVVNTLGNQKGTITYKFNLN